MRLNEERQEELEPKRMEFARQEIERLGHKITFESSNELRFQFNGKTVKFFPYSGWHTGATFEVGRGWKNLLKQIKP